MTTDVHPKLNKAGALNFIKAVSFVIIFIIILSVLSAPFLPKSNGVQNGLKNYLARGFYGEPKDSLDIIAIGNSNIVNGFSPMELWNQYGYTAYTCGEGWQTIYEAYDVLTEALTCQTPKVILLDADGIFNLSDSSRKTSTAIDMTIKHLFPVVEYHNRWKVMRFSDFTKRPDYSWTSSTRGFGLNNEIKGCQRPVSMIPAEEAEEIDLLALAQMDAIYALCQDKGIQLIFINVPTAFSWNYQRHNAVAEFAAEREIPYLDMNTNYSELGLDWTQDTRDGGVHLNCRGAKKVTAYLGEYLNSHYSLPDHRGDPAFSRWDADYSAYKKLITI